MLYLGFVDITTLRGPKQLIAIDKGLEWSIIRVYPINYYNSLLISSLRLSTICFDLRFSGFQFCYNWKIDTSRRCSYFKKTIEGLNLRLKTYFLNFEYWLSYSNWNPPTRYKNNNDKKHWYYRFVQCYYSRRGKRTSEWEGVEGERERMTIHTLSAMFATYQWQTTARNNMASGDGCDLTKTNRRDTFSHFTSKVKRFHKHATSPFLCGIYR